MCTNKKLLTHLNTSITLTPREAALGLSACAFGAVACLMTGMVVGMLISPRKNVAIGSHNGGNVVDKRTFADEHEAVPESDEIPF